MLIMYHEATVNIHDLAEIIDNSALRIPALAKVLKGFEDSEVLMTCDPEEPTFVARCELTGLLSECQTLVIHVPALALSSYHHEYAVLFCNLCGEFLYYPRIPTLMIDREWIEAESIEHYIVCPATE